MGYGNYSQESRVLRAASMGYSTKSMDQIFTQSSEKRVHESMSPKGISIRECCDSTEHPNVVPVILTLDVTGSMGKIPHNLVKEGLPTLMANMSQRGVDAALLFLAVGDHTSDRYPLQVAQFESGDAELDLWLTRTYIEGRGGANNGESYLLSWYFAANHTKTDAFSKRGKKGFLFTVGDEPCLPTLPSNVISEIMGAGSQKSYSAEELLAEAQKSYEVYHLHILHGVKSENALDYWKDLLGQNCVEVDDYHNVSNIIAEIVASNSSNKVYSSPKKDSKQEDIIL